METDFTLTLTDSAAENLNELLKDQATIDAYVRVWVAGGGCSGLQYRMAIDENEPEEGDIVVVDHDLKLVVDSLSAKYLSGSSVDWTEDVLGGGFQFKNPNATKSCGCANSFNTGEDGIEGLNEGRGCSGCGSN